MEGGCDVDVWTAVEGEWLAVADVSSLSFVKLSGDTMKAGLEGIITDFLSTNDDELASKLLCSNSSGGVFWPLACRVLLLRCGVSRQLVQEGSILLAEAVATNGDSKMATFKRQMS